MDVISKVADDFIFDLNDSGSREIMNSEIIREDLNFDVANLGGLIGLKHDEDNPVISTNNGYFLPSKSHPNNRLQNSDELEQGDFNNSLDKDGHSTLLSIPLIPKVVAAVFPAIIPQENSLLYNICCAVKLWEIKEWLVFNVKNLFMLNAMFSQNTWQLLLIIWRLV